jgi:hypothetical protein
MPHTYSTRHLTARDNQLIDALERSGGRYAKVAHLLRPPVQAARAAPKPQGGPPAATRAPAATPAPPAPAPAPAAAAAATPKPAPKPVSGMTMPKPKAD